MRKPTQAASAQMLPLDAGDWSSGMAQVHSSGHAVKLHGPRYLLPPSTSCADLASIGLSPTFLPSLPSPTRGSLGRRG